jgi:2,3-dihydroxybenzoate decarboxylase
MTWLYTVLATDGSTNSDARGVAYLRANFYITNSGVASEPAIRFTQAMMSADQATYAMDYPYQHPIEEMNILRHGD